MFINNSHIYKDIEKYEVINFNIKKGQLKKLTSVLIDKHFEKIDTINIIGEYKFTPYINYTNKDIDDIYTPEEKTNLKLTTKSLDRKNKNNKANNKLKKKNKKDKRDAENE